METAYRLSRIVRTPSSEIYLIWSGEERIGQVDLHFAGDTVHATIVLERDLEMEQEESLLEQLDDEIISSYLPKFERDDFVAYVFRGEQINRYTDSASDLDDLDFSDEEDEDIYDEDDEDDEEDDLS